MANLKLKITNQSLSAELDVDKLIENSFNYLSYEMEFSSDWEGYIKKVYFLHQELSEPRYGLNGRVPSRVLRAPGFEMRIVGKNPSTGQSISTNSISIPIFHSAIFSSDRDNVAKYASIIYNEDNSMTLIEHNGIAHTLNLEYENGKIISAQFDRGGIKIKYENDELVEINGMSIDLTKI